MITDVGIIGSGNLAFQLGRIFRESQVNVVGLHARDEHKAKALCEELRVKYFHEPSELIDSCELLFLAISDDALEEFSKTLPPGKAVLVHCSGSMDINQLDRKHQRAVFYPLQSFTRQSKPNWNEIPVLLECVDEPFKPPFETFAKKISPNIHWISSSERARIHMAAVLVNNFGNMLFVKAGEIMKENKLPFDLLIPLIKETVNRLEHLSPEQSQTGPAKRGDKNTIARHLEFLENDKDWQELYSRFSEIIAKKYS